MSTSRSVKRKILLSGGGHVAALLTGFAWGASLPMVYRVIGLLAWCLLNYLGAVVEATGEARTIQTARQ